MARKTHEKRLQELEEQKQKLTAKISKQKATLAAKKRKEDTRRKIIAGALALEHMEHDSAFQSTMMRLLNRHTKESDKHLFDFLESAAPPSPEEEKGSPNVQGVFGRTS